MFAPPALPQGLESDDFDEVYHLAAAVGVSARELDRPVDHLKNAGKIRTVGQRHLTRYFPLVGEATQVPNCQAASSAANSDGLAVPVR